MPDIETLLYRAYATHREAEAYAACARIERNTDLVKLYCALAICLCTASMEFSAEAAQALDALKD